MMSYDLYLIYIHGHLRTSLCRMQAYHYEKEKVSFQFPYLCLRNNTNHDFTQTFVLIDFTRAKFYETFQKASILCEIRF